MVTPLLIGVGVAGIAYLGKTAARVLSQARSTNPNLKYSFDNIKDLFQGFKNTISPAARAADPRLGFLPKMSRLEASQILNIPTNSPPDKIKQAHRQQMQINHPDVGGSMYVATKINEAKDVLLNLKKIDDE